jgi:ribonuclease R
VIRLPLPRPFPDRDTVLEFIRSSPVPVGKREIARAFHLSGSQDRERLKALLKSLESDGAVARGRGRRIAPPAALPEIAIVEIGERNANGDVTGVPADWSGDEPPPRIAFPPQHAGQPGLKPGDRVLARLLRIGEGRYEASVLRRMETAAGRVLGIFRPPGRLVSTDRRVKDEFVVPPQHSGSALPGELVLAEVLPSPRLGHPQVRIVERLGDTASPRAFSLIAIHSHGLPTEFPAQALEEAGRAAPPTADGRTDLRAVALVTIDGADARDFDDAVWAGADPDPANPGGWHLLVAIADVAWYVRPGSALDRAAFERGNSCYFPDRVVPMLPEALSNGACSLKPGEDRACLAAHLWIDRHGAVLRHRFERGLMRSAARLTYEQAQAAWDGQPDEVTTPLLARTIEPLFRAFACLSAARQRRGTLDLDLPERQVRLGDDGHVAAITLRQRLDSHRLIEEFMIAANVAAAQSLEGKKAPVLYRVHDRPAAEKLESLREVLVGLGMGLPKGRGLTPEHLTRVVRRAGGTPQACLVSDLVLRSQALAVYAPANIGHFGLALERYAHFTSPIRRYADLVVHRALIAAHGLGHGGLPETTLARLADIADRVSMAERRAGTAERDAVDRYTTAFLARQMGTVFAGRVVGVSRSGLFIRLDASGADGLIPASTLPDDRYDHDERKHTLTGRRWGRVWRLGAAVSVRVHDADPLTGSNLFVLSAMDDRPATPQTSGDRGENATLSGK